jgi:hypothetical protein
MIESVGLCYENKFYEIPGLTFLEVLHNVACKVPINLLFQFRDEYLFKEVLFPLD